MAGLLVGMTDGTGLRTETLTIAKNSLGRLHLTGATRTGTGTSWSHHNQLTQWCTAEKTEETGKNTLFPHNIHAEKVTTVHITCRN